MVSVAHIVICVRVPHWEDNGLEAGSRAGSGNLRWVGQEDGGFIMVSVLLPDWKVLDY